MHKKIKTTNKVSFAVGAVIILNCPTLFAYDFVKNFSLPATIQYDDNVALSSTGSVGAFRYLLTPNLNLSRQDEVDDISLRASLNIVRSSASENLILDREDPSLNANWLRRFERGSFSIGGAYVRSSTRVSEFDQTGQVFRDGNSTNRAINSSFNYELSERVNTTFDFRYNKQKYAQSNLSDFKSYVSSIQLNYAYSENLSLYTNAGYSKFFNQQTGQLAALNQDGEQNLKRFSVGVDYQYSPTMGLDLSWGQNNVSTGDRGWVAGVELQYEPNVHTTLNTIYTRGNYASGLGGFQEADNLSFSLNRVISDINNFGFSYTWNRNRSLNTNTTRGFTAFYKHELSQNWSALASYAYRNISSGFGPSATGAQINFTLSYNLYNF